ncbi:MAG: RagB/SusD family nutrient uptake outer membrane protein [Muribaculaceae bacterium]|nr:RagB/SusD family nutrient uptake outer membrane protein [Muribaculaceae bacterium]
MKLKYIIGISALAGLGLTACSDQMNYHEYRIQDEDFVKRDFGNVGKITTHVYRQLDYDLGQMYGGASLCSATDEAVYSHQGNQIESYFNGSWSPTNANSAIWSSCWEGISYCNLFLDEFNDLTFPDWTIDKYYNDNMIKYHNYQWEMRFMRAYYYFLLVRQYGNVPLITNYLNAEEANNAVQVTSDDIFDFIDNECVAIKDTIISDYNSQYNTLEAEPGRVNNLGVLALRARAALYHASPLFSKGKSDAEKKELWRKAAVYAYDCIRACTTNGMRLANDYSKLFGYDSYSDGEATKEIIFARRNTGDNAFEKRNFPIGMTNAAGGNCPTENLVSAYETTNGKSIDDPSNTMYDPQDPYKNRDSRFAATVAINGEKWPDALPIAGLETWYGGANSRSVTYGTPTGYYLKKYLNRTVAISGSSTSAQYHNWVIFRLGSLYLDYAEAMLNLTGSGYATEEGLPMSAAEAINKVRTRAGQPDLPTNLDKEAFTKRYENERFVELAFEGHRIFDVRRWMKAPEYFEHIKVMEITKNGDGTFSYQTVTDPSYITKRTWPGDKAYFWPIPQAEVLKSGNLKQNEGWQ